MQQLKAGSRMRSTVCTTELMVVKTPTDAIDLRCGGQPVATLDTPVTPGAAPLAGLDAGSALGKRYATDDGALELLVTKAGAGSLSVADKVLALKDAKKLPSSD